MLLVFTTRIEKGNHIIFVIYKKFKKLEKSWTRNILFKKDHFYFQEKKDDSDSDDENDRERQDAKLKLQECAYESLGKAWPRERLTQGDYDRPPSFYYAVLKFGHLALAYNGYSGHDSRPSFRTSNIFLIQFSFISECIQCNIEYM